MTSYAPWLDQLHHSHLAPSRLAIETHPFMQAMESGSADPKDAQRFFSGLMWHLIDFGKHVSFHMAKRPPEVSQFLSGKSEDTDGDTDILARIVGAFGGPVEVIATRPWTYRPHAAWIHHDALLRSAIYSSDLPWQVGTAALNVGIESLVPTMIEPLFRSCVKNYGVTTEQARWLESRSGEEEKQHGENGYLILNKFVDREDLEMQERCALYIQALSQSMSQGLFASGLRNRASE